MTASPVFSSLSLDEQFSLLDSTYESNMEPEIINSLDQIMNYSVDIKTTEKSLTLIDIIIKKINPHCIDKLLPPIFHALTSIKWQVKRTALVTMAKFADYHPVVTAQNMPQFINKLIEISSDPKKEIKQQVHATFKALRKTI
jgi:hypothetical protein